MSVQREYLVTVLLCLIVICSTLLCLYDKLNVESLKTIFMVIVTLASAWLGIQAGYRLALRK